MHGSLATPPGRQRGWVGLIVLLLAVLIVGILARSVLKQYGLFDDGIVVSKQRVPLGSTAGASGAALPSSVEASGLTTGSAAPPPPNVLDQARDMGATMQRQADDIGKRMDAAEK